MPKQRAVMNDHEAFRYFRKFRSSFPETPIHKIENKMNGLSARRKKNKVARKSRKANR